MLYTLSRGEESHDKDCSNKCPEGGFIDTQKGKKVTNRCRSALVQSVLSSLVLVQGARARARALWRLSGHTLLSREMRERETLAAVFLEVELNSGEICRVYKAAG